ncbi:TOBE domain-containing protein [Bosea sp. (in: a-proteobacteria)]
MHVAAATRQGAGIAVRIPFGHEAIGTLARGEDVWLGFQAEDARVFA